jgi:hypothetical protein
MQIDLSTMFQSWDSLIAVIQIILTLVLTEISKRNIKWLNTEEKKLNLKQLASWTISISLSFVGWYQGLGIFAGTTWITTIIYGLILGLVSNGVFDISIVKSFLTKKAEVVDGENKS